MGARDTHKLGLIRDNKDPKKSGTYVIGQILGSGMIGVACLCRNEQTAEIKCLKHMSMAKIREKNLFKNIMDEVTRAVEEALELPTYTHEPPFGFHNNGTQWGREQDNSFLHYLGVPKWLMCSVGFLVAKVWR